MEEGREKGRGGSREEKRGKGEGQRRGGGGGGGGLCDILAGAHLNETS